MIGTLTRIVVADPEEIGTFWDAATVLAIEGIHEDSVVFEAAGVTADLFGDRIAIGADASAVRAFRALLPPALLATLDKALLHRDPERFALCYRLLRRVRLEPQLLSVATDRNLSQVRSLEKSVRRDMHKMTAFVRFREVTAPDGGSAFIAWFEPDHHIVKATAPFFMRRFASMRWSILTPGKSVHWDGEQLSFSDGAARADAAEGDPVEAMWRTYYAHIFNPARLKVKAMQAEMPKKYWRNLPEASLIEPLILGARARSDAMIAAPAAMAAPRKPPADKSLPLGDAGEGGAVPASIDDLAAKEEQCQRCPLYKDATQAVPGIGPHNARLMIVGEQPGDQEDLQGLPFVGPAGKVLDAALERAGIDRSICFVTNAVKHFKFEPRGKRRLHKTPNPFEIDRCRWWLEHERRLVKPELIVALGATAARSVLGHPVKIGEMRGRLFDLEGGGSGLITVHPSYLLRIREEEDKKLAWKAFLTDLRVVAARLNG
jgi:uracil-DNA glycosylase